MSNDRYPAQVFWSEDDDGFIAIAPDLPGCSAFGETESEALAELKLAIEAWKDAAQAAGNPIPSPSNLGADKYSGKILVRMPKALHRDLAHASERQGVSLNQYINYLLSNNGAFALASSLQFIAQSVPRSGFGVIGASVITRNGMPIQAFGSVHPVSATRVENLLTLPGQSQILELNNA